MTAGYFPYRPTRMNAAPMLAPSRYDDQRPTVPTTYDAARHEVCCIVATQSPVRRQFGLEVLRISDSAVDLGLLDDGRLPLLDAHDSRHVLGGVRDVWVNNRKFYGTLRFDRTPAGRMAEAAVARGELRHTSCWCSVKCWTDSDGDLVPSSKLLNPHFSTWSRDGGPQTFTATHWVLHEISLTTVPADPLAVIL